MKTAFAGVLIAIPLIAIYVTPQGSPLYGILVATWGGAVIAVAVAGVAAMVRRLRKR